MASVLDIIKHYQQVLEKHSDDEARVLRCIDKLFQLQVTVQHLQETGVGRTVNALRKEPGEVGQAARSLVLKWKTMVAAEESDQEGDPKTDTSTHNGHSSGRDSDDHTQQPKTLLDHYKSPKSSTPKDNHRENHKEMNGHHSGSKRKYHSEEEDHDDKKKVRHTSSSEDDHKKNVHIKQEKMSESEMSGDDSESSESDSDSYTSESSREEVKYKQEIKQEIKKEKESPKIHKSSSSKHSHSNHVEDKRESSSSKRPESDRHSHHKTSSKDDSKNSESSKSSSHKHKSSHEKESSSDKRQKSDSSSGEKKESSKHSSEKHSSKYSSQERKSSSERHKSADNHTSKHKSSSHTNDSSEKHKSSEKDTSKHKSKENSSSSKDRNSSSKDRSSTSKDRSSSSKDKSSTSKDRSSSSKDRSSHSQSSEGKHLSSESKSHSSDSKHHRSDSKSQNSDKSKHKSEEGSGEKRSKEKSSSSSSHKSKSSSSSSKSKEDVPKKKSKLSNSEDSGEDGIDCGSGASFAEALGMISPAKPKKKSGQIRDINSPNNSFSNDLSPAALLAPTAKLAPLPALEISALPEISPNYRPRPPPKFLPHFTDEDAISAGISSKNQRTKVYSGNKTFGKVSSLYEMCVHVLQEHIDALEFTGGVPYEILKPVVDRATPQQLFVLEHYNPYLMEDTDHLWQKFCEKSFRNKRRQELESWREMFMRCQEEQEHKLKSLTANIKLTQEAKKAPIKQTKMAYVDTVVKPPRNIARKQDTQQSSIIVVEPKTCSHSTNLRPPPAAVPCRICAPVVIAVHGTAHASTASPASRVASLSATPNVLRGGAPRPPLAVPVSAASFNKPKKAPLMQKALQFMRGRKR